MQQWSGSEESLFKRTGCRCSSNRNVKSSWLFRCSSYACHVTIISAHQLLKLLNLQFVRVGIQLDSTRLWGVTPLKRKCVHLIITCIRYLDKALNWRAQVFKFITWKIITTLAKKQQSAAVFALLFLSGCACVCVCVRVCTCQYPPTLFHALIQTLAWCWGYAEILGKEPVWKYYRC